MIPVKNSEGNLNKFLLLGLPLGMRIDPVPAGSDHYFHTVSVRPSHIFKIKRQSLPAGTVGWPSASLMTPVIV